MSIYVCIPPLDIWCGVSDSPTCAAAVAAVIQPHTKSGHQKCRKEEEPSELDSVFFFISQKKKKRVSPVKEVISSFWLTETTENPHAHQP